MRLFFIIFMVTGSVISGIMTVFYHSEINSRLDSLKTQEKFAVELQSHVIGDVMDSIAADLFFLSRQNELLEYLVNRHSWSLDEIGREYLILLEQKKIYDQIRFIDKNGMESVRVNYNHGSPVLVAADQLQSKKKRYYFEDCYRLPNNKVFISPFDLNIEHGEVERPLKPMIRFGTPVFDADNQKQGIVLLNYLGKDLTDRILESEALSAGQTMLLNSDGYWLLNPDPEQEWGFMFQDEGRRFSRRYPLVWNEMTLKGDGQFHSSDGLFTFKTISPLREGFTSSTGSGVAYNESRAEISHNAYQWHLVSYIPAQVIRSYSDRLLMRFFSFGSAVFLIVATGSWIISYAIAKRQMYQAQLKGMALFDPLTELPNRRLFFDRLEMVLAYNRRYKNMFGILYIDLDGFKTVNDTYGHKAGDELLRIVSQRLVNVCRKSDTVARLGGDEFAVIVDRVESPDGMKTVAQKIIASIAEPIELETGTAQVSASIGISIFPDDSSRKEELVQLADQAMYQSKSRGKNTYTLVGMDYSYDGVQTYS